MARAWLVTSRGIAKKIKEPAQFSSKQIIEPSEEAKRECPNCNHVIDNSDVNIEWPGLPAGVKFDPSDLQLIKHLEGKVGMGNSKPHMFIDVFIPTIEEEQGICYTHPENLPGIKKDGNCAHFFHKISNAYASGPRKLRKINTEDSGPRKRRKINTEHSSSISVEHVRWHKTGKTKPIKENDIQKGWKKIMVLYKSAQRGCRADKKANWVMHQYHLGTEEEEEEKDGQMVVSKIFYQLGKEKEKFELESVEGEDDNITVHATTVSPRTPMPKVPQPPHQKKSSQVELPVQNVELVAGQDMQHQEKPTSPVVCLKNEGTSVLWENESQAVEESDPNKLDHSLLCHEVLDSFPLDSSLDFGLDGILDAYFVRSDLRCGNFTSPPDLHISELPFGSQDSISSWWKDHD